MSGGEEVIVGRGRQHPSEQQLYRWRAGLREAIRRAAWRLRGVPDLLALERAGLRLGKDAYIGIGASLDPDFCFLISIGDRSVLSVNVTVLAHDASTRASIGWTRVAAVKIGADVFVGAGVIILPGVTVGDRAVIAAGSIVRHDVPAGTIVAGNPAQKVGQVDEYVALHGRRVQTTPQWPRYGWTTATGITPDRVEAMRAALAEHGEAYIK